MFYVISLHVCVVNQQCNNHRDRFAVIAATTGRRFRFQSSMITVRSKINMLISIGERHHRVSIARVDYNLYLHTLGTVKARLAAA